MIRHEYLEDIGLHHIRCSDPFAFEDLLKAWIDLHQAGGEAGDFARPMLFDMRLVEITGVRASSFIRLIALRKGAMPQVTDNPAAFVTASESDLRKLRLYGIYADLMRFRSEHNMLGTTDFEEALRWIADRLGIANADELRRRLERP